MLDFEWISMQNILLEICKKYVSPEVENAAVSNTVLWSQRKKSGANVNPSQALQDLSSKIWREFLKVLKPNYIVSSGKVAESVINNAGWKGKHSELRLPAKTAMSRISGMFNINDLLKRYPEVEYIIQQHPGWVQSYKANKILFACHAVSLLK
ncbi:MAG: hypothetical protein KAW82_03170 [Desulfurellaceae bacterium]|nr:hypothetical protein [Desulfurellaceae bacterium]